MTSQLTISFSTIQILFPHHNKLFLLYLKSVRHSCSSVFTLTTSYSPLQVAPAYYNRVALPIKVKIIILGNDHNALSSVIKVVHLKFIYSHVNTLKGNSSS